MRHGFSLVELSIVLVILGLLTGGILAGQSLIRASELRAVSTEYSRYVAATQTFRDKYFGLPGDLRDATRFWTRQTNTADCVTNSSAAVSTPGSCDGDGDGNIEVGGTASQSGEIFQYWRQLGHAGLIEGSYSGIAGAGGAWEVIRSTNAPPSKLSNAGWGVAYQVPSVGATSYFDGPYGNFLLVGGSTTGGGPSGSVFKAEEAWNIDTKMDDGKPATGSVLARNRVNCTLKASGAAQTTAAGDAALLDSVYNLVNSSQTCAVLFRNLF